jgi:transposase
MNTVNSRRKYDREFKLEAVRLVTQGGRPVSEVARDLGIHENLLYNWRKNIWTIQPMPFRVKVI